MCIRDSYDYWREPGSAYLVMRYLRGGNLKAALDGAPWEPCLLYTSDAADERSSVDLGGRRIIKKKTRLNSGGRPNRSKSTQKRHQSIKP